MTTDHPTSCELCDGDGGTLIFRADQWRVVRVEGAEGDAYPGYCRVIWNTHIRELTDLSAADRQSFMEAVFKVEAALRKSFAPVKMNVASLGNLTPHLHWHVIPRYTDDAAFPKPVWAIDLATPSRRDTLSIAGRARAVAAENGTWQHEVRRALETD